MQRFGYWKVFWTTLASLLVACTGINALAQTQEPAPQKIRINPKDRDILVRLFPGPLLLPVGMAGYVDVKISQPLALGVGYLFWTLPQGNMRWTTHQVSLNATYFLNGNAFMAGPVVLGQAALHTQTFAEVENRVEEKQVSQLLGAGGGYFFEVANNVHILAGIVGRLPLSQRTSYSKDSTREQFEASLNEEAKAFRSLAQNARYVHLHLDVGVSF